MIRKSTPSSKSWMVVEGCFGIGDEQGLLRWVTRASFNRGLFDGLYAALLCYTSGCNIINSIVVSTKAKGYTMIKQLQPFPQGAWVSGE